MENTSRNSLVDFFQDFASLENTFLVYDDGYRPRSYTYRQVAGAARGFARKLRDADIQPGERIIIWGENRPEWVAVFWGCVLAGVVLVPVDYRTSHDLVERIRAIVSARVVVAGEEVPRHVGDWRLAELDWSAATFQPVNAMPGDLCEIIFTSGATADPKGVTITHANILANIVPVETEIRKYRKWSRPFSPIRFLNLLPLSHMFGQSMATFIPPILPGEVVFMAGFNPRDIVRQIRSRRISVLVSVPKILEVLRDYIVREYPEVDGPTPPGNWMRRWWHYRRVHNLFGWKFWSFIVGAAPLPGELEEFWSKLGFVVIQGYGLTETAPIVTLNHPFHTSRGSVGKPIGGVELKIADDGEILVRGANVTSGYFQAAGEDAAFQDGWFHTGDIGAVDSEGRVFVRGRKKEMIVTPEGLNVFPEDVERVLNALSGVRESAVVGQSAAHAVLVLEAGVRPEPIVEQANTLLESHQRIRAFSIWNDGPLPRTEGTGKLKRVALLEWVMGRAAPATQPVAGDALLGKYSDDTPLAQLALSSLDRVELMMQAERGNARGIDEGSFTHARTVGDLRRLAQQTPETATQIVEFPRWNRALAARLLRAIAQPLVLLPLLRIFVWLRVNGREHLRDLEGPVLFAANHQSLLDGPAILAALPARWRNRLATAMGMEWFRAHFHMKDASPWERFGNSLQFYLSSLFFITFPIPQREAGARETLRYAGELASGKWSVLLFPEGIRTQHGEIAPFRAGVGMMASRLSLPVVPVRIDGLGRVLHSSAKWPTPGRVTVSFGRPLRLDGDDYGALAKQVEAAVRALG